MHAATRDGLNEVMGTNNDGEDSRPYHTKRIIQAMAGGNQGRVYGPARSAALPDIPDHQFV